MASKDTARCPLCEEPLVMPECYCTYCQKTFLECPSCHHLHPDWLTECAYCHASVLPDRALEIDDKAMPDTRTSAPQSVHEPAQRAARLESSRELRQEYPEIDPEDFEQSSPGHQSESGERMKFATEQYDEEELLDAARRRAVRKEARRLEAEKLNPHRVVRATRVTFSALGAGYVLLCWIAVLAFVFLRIRELVSWQFIALIGAALLLPALLVFIAFIHRSHKDSEW